VAASGRPLVGDLHDDGYFAPFAAAIAPSAAAPAAAASAVTATAPLASATATAATVYVFGFGVVHIGCVSAVHVGEKNGKNDTSKNTRK